MSADTVVWHYTSLEAVIAILREKKLRFTRLDVFHDSDPFEGSVPKQQIDDQTPIFCGAQATEMMLAGVASHFPGMDVPRTQYRDPWGQMTKRRQAGIRSTHAICWRWGDESEAMWKLYCKDGRPGQGLALRATLGKLETSVSNYDLYISPVQYRFLHEGAAFDNEIDPFLHKRKGFEYEQEVRLLNHDETHYLALAQYLIDDASKAQPAELPEYRFFDWSLVETIDAIAVSPYADEIYELKVRDEITKIEPEIMSRIELSVLSERRYAINL